MQLGSDQAGSEVCTLAAFHYFSNDVVNALSACLCPLVSITCKVFLYRLLVRLSMYSFLYPPSEHFNLSISPSLFDHNQHISLSLCVYLTLSIFF
jgi:hypothetical protein